MTEDRNASADSVSADYHPAVRCIRDTDTDWPDRLKGLPSMPHALYFIGDLPRDDQPACAIIGSRMCSPYGHRIAAEFGSALASRGIQIISGMAVGVDGYAQEGALRAGGRSFGVLGSGPDVCYPPANEPLYRQLIKSGGVLSELKPGSPPIGRQFAARNRLISAFADLVLVVEAKLRSGTNLTVDFALQQGKNVFAVPGRIGDHLSDGCNYLIAQGAGIAYAPEALLNEFQMSRSTLSFADSADSAMARRRKQEERVLSDPALTKEARRIYRALSFEDTATPDILSDALGMEISSVLSALTSLVIEGYAEEELRGCYVRSRP